MKVTCSGCGARHWLPDMNVAGGACRVVCPNCSSEAYVDASMIEPQVLEARWHLAVNGETVGPVSAHDIEQYYQNGQITMESLLWCDGMAGWEPLSAVAEFDYLQVPVSGEPADSLANEETRVGAPPAGFAASDEFGGGGEETSAIDISEFSTGSEQAGIVGMGGSPAEDEFSFDMGTPQQAPAPQAGSGFDNANDLVGARSENSVLFSLSSLQAVSAPAPAASSSSGGFGGSNDGLIDVKALANAAPNMGKKRKSFEASPADLGSLGMVNRNIEFGNKKDNTPLIVGIIVGGVVLIGLIIALVLTSRGGDVPQQQVNANIDAEAQQAQAGGLGVEDEAAKKAKAEEEAKAKAKAEEEAKAKAEEEAKAKAEEEAKAKAEEEAKAKAEEEAKAKAEEEAKAKAEEEAKAAAAKKADTTKKADTKKADTKKTDTKAADSKPAASGGAALTKEQVQSVIRSSFANVRTCSRTSTKKGQMKVSFMIKADGRVTGAKCVSPEFAGSPAASCVVKVVNGLKFPASSKDTPVTYPFPIQ